MKLPNETVSTPAIATSLICNENGSDNQTKANKVPKDISANAHKKTHVSQRLGFLQPTNLEDPASRRFSILVSLPSNVATGATINTHVHSVREKRSNGTVLYQIEVVAPHGPSLILTCKNDFHRDYVFQRLSDRNMKHGSQTAVALSMERAENNDASANAQWYLPIEFDDSVSAIFETLRNSFRNTGIIPGKDLIERVLVIHAGSDLWLKKYAMTSKGFTKRLLHAELAGSHEECCICQEVIQGHQSFLTGHTSNQAGDLSKNVTPSPKEPSPLTQVAHMEGKSWPASPDTKTALDTSNFPDRPAAQSTEEGDVFFPWQVPAAHSSSLAEVTTSQFVADFAKLSGRERACAVTRRDVVSAFNDYLDANCHGSFYKDEMSVLHRKIHDVFSPSFHTNFPMLEDDRLLMQEMNLSKLPSSATAPVLSEPSRERSHSMDQLARNKSLRSRKHRGKKAREKYNARDQVIPGTVANLGNMEPGVESPRVAAEASGGSGSCQLIYEKSKAEKGEAAGDGGAKRASSRKRCSNTEHEVYLVNPVNHHLLSGLLLTNLRPRIFWTTWSIERPRLMRTGQGKAKRPCVIRSRVVQMQEMRWIVLYKDRALQT